MKKRGLIYLLMSSLLFSGLFLPPPSPAHAETIRLMPEHDVSVYERSPNQNFNLDGGVGTDSMRVRGFGAPSDAAVSYYTFDVSNQTAIGEAVFKVYGRVTSTLPDGQSAVIVDVYAVPDTSWDESTLTWNTQPALGDKLASVPIGTTNGTHSFTVTDYVNAQIAAGSKVSLALVMEEPYQFFTRGRDWSSVNQRPALELVPQSALPVRKDLEPDGRSILYPADWYPGYSDSEGRFLHDFSYAGYRMGEEPIPTAIPGIQVDVTAAPYGADPTGTADSTNAIQAAIDHVSQAGGGVVYLPPGTYRVKPQPGRSNTLSIAASGVVLRGAGPDQTFLFNDETNMRGKHMITVSTPGGWGINEASRSLIAGMCWSRPTGSTSRMHPASSPEIGSCSPLRLRKCSFKSMTWRSGGMRC